MDLVPFDELNKFEDGLSIHFNAEGKIASKKDAEDIIDELQQWNTNTPLYQRVERGNPHPL